MASAAKRLRVDNCYYQAAWEDDYFVVALGDSCKCLVCAYVFGTNRKSVVQKHFETRHAGLNADFPEGSPAQKLKIEALKSKLEKLAPLDPTNMVSRDANSTTRLSYKIAYILAKAMKPYEDGSTAKKIMIETANELIEDPEVKRSLLEKVESTPVSSRTITRRVQAISTDINDQLMKDLEECEWFSMQLDESTDITDTAQVSVFIRMVFRDYSTVEELLSVIPLQEGTIGRDIFTAIKDNLTEKNVPLNKLVSITTDGAPAMVGYQAGSVVLCKEDPDISSTMLNFHCIIHQQALCVKSVDMTHVMEPVLKIVGSIRARPLQHRLFQPSLKEADSDYNDLITRGKVLERFHEALPEIREFLESGNEDIQQLHDQSWLADLAFFTDLIKQINNLNSLLQGKDIPIWIAAHHVMNFRRELKLWIDFFQRNGVSRKFENLTKIQQALGAESNFCGERFASYLENLAEQFQQRFQHLENIQKIREYFCYPLRTENSRSIAGTISNLFPALDVFSIEEEIRSLALNETYRSILGNKTCVELDGFWKMVDQMEYSNLTGLYKRLLSCFGSSYLCQSMFSLMKHIKSRLRSRLTDENLESLLRISVSSYEPDFQKLAENAQTTSQH